MKNAALRFAASLIACSLAACGATSSHDPTAAAATASGRTRYRVGDYVVYRYFGRHIGPEPRLLMEEVISQEGDTLVIEVTLTEGHTTLRRWRQTVIDTEENRRANRVEALCEFRTGAPAAPTADGTAGGTEGSEPSSELPGEACVALANEGNADLFRLYEGLVITPDAPPETSTESEEQDTVAGVEMTCTHRVTHVLFGGEPIDITEIECPDFLWTHAGAVFERADKRRLLQVTVEAAGSAS